MASPPHAPLPAELPLDFGAIVGRLLGSLRQSGLVTDTTPGGVARTLAETFARELALFYEVMQRAHSAGYLNTAEGEALDQVVALLGLQRARAGRLSGYVLFGRQTPAPEDIVLPAGLRVAGRPPGPRLPAPILEVVQTATLAQGQRGVLVAVQEIQGEETPALLSLPARALGILPRPLWGIESAQNPEAITRAGVDEDDESLRARARAALRAGELGTLESIEAAVRAQGVRQLVVSEPTDDPPGRVRVQIGDVEVAQDPERWAAVQAAVARAKAAGVRVELERMQAVLVLPEVELHPSRAGLDRAEALALRQAARQVLAATVGALGPGQPVLRRRLEGVLMALPGVADARVLPGTRTQPLTLGPAGVVAGADDSAARALPEGAGWAIGALEQATLDPTRWPEGWVRVVGVSL